MLILDSYNGEAFYNDKMADVVKRLEDKHLLKTSQGAEIVDLSAYNLESSADQEVRWRNAVYDA